MKSGIYIIRNLINNKVYVGSTKDFEKRKKQHFKNLILGKHNTKFQNAFKKYGLENFNFEIIQRVEYNEHILEIENYWIKTLDSKKYGYNIADAAFGDTLTNNPRKEEIKKAISRGLNKMLSSMSDLERREKYGKSGPLNGMFNKKHSATSKNKMSETVKKSILENGTKSGWRWTEDQKQKLSDIAKTRTGDKNPFFGKKHSDETKEKLRKSRLGIVPSNTKNISVDGIIYQSRRIASEQLGIKQNTLTYRANSKNYPNIFWVINQSHPSIKAEMAV